ncbi:MAG: response regulator, partial [Solirubrobacteraceae bacterium]
DGTITIESEVGVGRTVRCVLPTSATPPEPDAAAPVDDPGVDEPPEARRPRVLFVDDEQALARLAERALPMSGCDATVFVDPHLALDAFAATPGAFDALVTDLAMPGLSGLELIDRIRGIRGDLPVVLTTGFLSGEERRDADARGVDAILPKPCAIGDLADTVIGLVGAAG